MEKEIQILFWQESNAHVAKVRVMLAEHNIAYQMEAVADEASFKSALRKQSFDMILFDVDVAAVDGFIALSLGTQLALKAFIIILSEKSSEQQVRDYYNLGADEFVTYGHLKQLVLCAKRILDKMRLQALLNIPQFELEAKVNGIPTLVVYEISDQSVGDNGIIKIDNAGKIIFANEFALKMIGMKEQQILGQSLRKFFSLNRGHQELEKLSSIDIASQRLQKEFGLPDKQYPIILSSEGDYLSIAYYSTLLHDSNDDLSGAMIVFQDQSTQAQLEQRLSRHLCFDILTDLPNRYLFEEVLTDAIKRAQKSRTLCAVIFIDLDDFKDVNETFGHQFGDKLIQVVATRILESAANVTIVARFGGDEFAVLYEQMMIPEKAVEIAENILSVLKTPVVISEKSVYVSASIGVSVYPYSGNDASELIKKSDSAMYQAKSFGPNNIKFSYGDFNSISEESLQLKVDIIRAYKNHEMQVFLQPEFNLATEAIVGFEALIRWHHPEKGLLLPEIFIPVALATDCINEITKFVLSQCCEIRNDWLAKKLISEGTKFSINISAYQLESPLPELLLNVITEYNVNREVFEIEITETEIMNNFQQSLEIISILQKNNIAITMDDFGTGLASLSYLAQIPLSTIKIDKSFIDAISDSKKDRDLVAAIIKMAEAMKLHVVAEGVETKEQYEFLQDQGCETIQGYYLCKTLPAKKIEKYLRDRKN